VNEEPDPIRLDGLPLESLDGPGEPPRDPRVKKYVYHQEIVVVDGADGLTPDMLRKRK
jgi:hypothetical protein